MINRLASSIRCSVATSALVALSLTPMSLAGTSPSAALAALAAHDTLRVGLLLSVAADRSHIDAIERGVALGVEEASRTGALFGLRVEVVTERGEAGAETLLAAQRLLARPVSVVIATIGDTDCGTLETLAADRRVVLLNLDCSQDIASRDACDRLSFYIRPGAAAMRRARDRLARVAADNRAAVPRIALWHPTLRRFGAAQLNERFRRRFASEMESSAWAGWVAMKILTEAALRAGSARANDLARYLARSDVRFDGHKGEPLSFDPATGELRQPLYLVGPRPTDQPDSGVVRESPVVSELHVVSELPINAAFGPGPRDRRGPC